MPFCNPIQGSATCRLVTQGNGALHGYGNGYCVVISASVLSKALECVQCSDDTSVEISKTCANHIVFVARVFQSIML